MNLETDVKQSYCGIFDSHAHYDDERFANDLDAVYSQITGNGVCNVVNVGCDLKSSADSIALTERFEQFYASVGIHPHEASTATEGYLDKLRTMTEHNKVVAIGEIGLDYHYDLSPRDVQQRVFEQQLALARELDLPVIIHSREATADTLSRLEHYHPRGVVHCFTGSAQTAQAILDLDMYIGFTGAVTFPNIRKALESLAIIPAHRIMLETDCPYMAPVPFRGKRTTSDMIAFTAERIASVKQMPVQELIDIARENTKRLFRIL